MRNVVACKTLKIMENYETVSKETLTGGDRLGELPTVRLRLQPVPGGRRKKMCADKKARGWDRGRKRRTLLSERLERVTSTGTIWCFR